MVSLRTANRRRLKKRRGHPLDRPRPMTGFPFSAACWTTSNMHESVGRYREAFDDPLSPEAVQQHWALMFQAIGLPPPK
jgi:hypothetical protein